MNNSANRTTQPSYREKINIDDFFLCVSNTGNVTSTTASPEKTNIQISRWHDNKDLTKIKKIFRVFQVKQSPQTLGYIDSQFPIPGV